MHKVRLLALLSGVLFLTSVSYAQTATGETLMLDLPRQSQHALVMQRIGITDITVNYHRPLANGRQIWGKLAPYGQVWRAGANENTTITFSDPVTIEGQPLDKGTYGLHMIPGESQWTVIFSKNSTSWGSFTYKQEEDALRVNVKPQAAEAHDALTYDFDEVKPDSTIVTMRWDKVAVPFKVQVKVNDLVIASIHRQLHGLNQYYWEGWDDAAGYFLANKIDLDEALKDEDQSIQAEERYDNVMNKSLILAALGRTEDASTFRAKALDMANAAATLWIWPAVAGREEAGRGSGDLPFEREEVSRLLDFASGTGPGLQRAGRLRQRREGNEAFSHWGAGQQQERVGELHEAAAGQGRY